MWCATRGSHGTRPERVDDIAEQIAREHVEILTVRRESRLPRFTEIDDDPDKTNPGMNDGMGAWIAPQVIKLLAQKNDAIADARVLVLGATFKENTPDIRNSRLVDIVTKLEQYGCDVQQCDPWVDTTDSYVELDREVLADIPNGPYEAGCQRCVVFRYR